MVDLAQRARERQAIPTMMGLACAGALVGGLLLVAGTLPYNEVAAIVVAPVLVLLTLPAIARQARRQNDPKLFRLMMAGLVARFAGALMSYHLVFAVYGGVIDANGYDRAGAEIAARFARGDFHTGLPDLIGTNFIKLLTGVLYTFIGPSMLAGFFVYAWLAFWGMLFLYRAFLRAVPDGRRRTYARLLFLLPSLVFWPSAIGKEAWMVFSIGVVAAGVSRLLVRFGWRGFILTVLGLSLTAVVRPPVAGLLGVSLSAAFLVRPPARSLRSLAPLAKVAGLAVVVLLALVLVNQTGRFLQRANIQTDQGLSGVLQEVNRRTAKGGSQYSASIVQSPKRIPIAIGTVLFRPFILEVDNGPSQAAAYENLFLLVLFVVRLRWVWAAFASARRQPYVVFAFVFVVLFALGYSTLANFGYLVRERLQILPFFLVLISIPPPTRDRSRRSSSVRSSVVTTA